MRSCCGRYVDQIRGVRAEEQNGGQTAAAFMIAQRNRCQRELLFLFLGRRGLLRWCCGRIRARLVAAHALLKTANAFSKTAHHFGNPAAAEENQDDYQDD